MPVHYYGYEEGSCLTFYGDDVIKCEDLAVCCTNFKIHLTLTYEDHVDGDCFVGSISLHGESRDEPTSDLGTYNLTCQEGGIPVEHLSGDMKDAFSLQQVVKAATGQVSLDEFLYTQVMGFLSRNYAFLVRIRRDLDEVEVTVSLKRADVTKYEFVLRIPYKEVSHIFILWDEETCAES